MGFHINSGNKALLPYSSIPYIEGNVHIAAFAFDVAGIEGFRVTALEDMALATNLAIMQAFPCIKDIGLTLFLGGVVNLRRLHKLYKLKTNRIGVK
jgi:hypothetical protein